MFSSFNKPQGQTSLFGNTNTVPTNAFQPQQPLQQQQQMPSVFANNTQLQQQAQPPSRFEKYELKDSSEHHLFTADFDSNASAKGTNGETKDSNGNITNSTNIKKRTIPSHLVKRIGKKNNNANEEDKPLTPILPFKASTQIQSDNNFEKDFSHLFQNDRPPQTSMFDPSVFQDELTPGEMLTGESIFNKMNENPVMYENIFQRANRNLLKTDNILNSNFSNNVDYPWSNGDSNKSNSNTSAHSTKSFASNSSSQNQTSTPQQKERLYCSVIIYGFDDIYFSLIVEHFSKYGKIMEDLVTSDYNYYYGSLGNIIAHDKLVDSNKTDANKNDKKNLNLFPLFLGPSWVKITYDNPNSAIRALADNLTDDGKGNVLGVIPYRRKDLELLLNHTIPDDLNIGEGLHGLSHELELENTLADNEIGRYLANTRSESLDTGKNTNNSNTRKSSSLTIKDGSKLLINKKAETEGKTFWSRGMELIFGQGEI